MFPIFLIPVLAAVVAGCGGGIVGEQVGDYDDLIDTGWELYNQARYDEAYQAFLRAKGEDALRPESYIGSGWALLRRQHPDSAIVAFKMGFDFITSLEDTVDALCGLAGSYLARGENAKVIELFKKYPVGSYEDSFPLAKHDFFLDETDLEIVQAMACYRLGLYSPVQSPDPDNTVYHLNRVLLTPVEFEDPRTLMETMLKYIEEVKGDYYS